MSKARSHAAPKEAEKRWTPYRWVVQWCQQQELVRQKTQIPLSAARSQEWDAVADVAGGGPREATWAAIR
jgi:hypothetical protein